MDEIKACLDCKLPICDDRSKECAFVQIKPRVVKAEREQERIEKRQALNRKGRKMYATTREKWLANNPNYHAKYREANREKSRQYHRERYERLKKA